MHLYVSYLYAYTFVTNLQSSLSYKKKQKKKQIANRFFSHRLYQFSVTDYSFMKQARPSTLAR